LLSVSCAALVAIACHATAHSVAAAPVKATKRTSDDEKRASSKIVVGTAGEVAWIAADLAVRYSAGKGTTLRVVELVDPRGKATVASFGLTSPRTAAAAIAADAHVIVEGTDKREYAVGPASANRDANRENRGAAGRRRGLQGEARRAERAVPRRCGRRRPGGATRRG
jgi:hypothetical protein